jgi:hypothetical protein
MKHWGIVMKTLLTLLCLAGAVCFAQENSSQDMKDMNMPGHDMSKMAAQDSGEDADASSHAMHSMEGHHMEMGAHMKMTALRTPQPGDAGKAQQVAESARGVMGKYKDYHVALDDGLVVVQFEFHRGSNRLRPVGNYPHGTSKDAHPQKGGPRSSTWT